MRAPAVSFAKRFAAALMASLLTFTLLPASALAEEEGDNLLGEGSQETNSIQADEATGANASESTEPDTAVSAPLASVLAGAPTSFVNADVALDGEPVVGSFTIDGMTFAVTEGSNVQLVGVSEAAGASPRRVVASSQGLSAPLALPDLGSTPAASETEAESAAFQLPGSVDYNDAEYVVGAIGAYAFYLSGITSIELPASVIDVDDRAFRSSDVASVDVAEGNPNYSSFDGALYDAEQSSLLLIPEGKQGTVLLPKTAESAAPSVFSHCPLVTQVSVEEGSAAFASENGLLYDASLETLLRVPAGATDITIREGCTTIAAGAMEACASLATINAPASVTSISPDVFTSVPTISLPAAALVEKAPQLTALVALSSTDDDLPDVDPESILVALAEDALNDRWSFLGFQVKLTQVSPEAALGSAETYSAVALGLYDADYYEVKLYDAQTGAYGPMSTIAGNYTNDAVVQWTAYGPDVSASNVNFWVGDDLRYMWSFVPKREGYRFVGWSYQRGGICLAGQVGPSNAAASLFCNWVPVSYTVAFDMNGVAGDAPDSIAGIYGEDVILPEASCHGYRFLGWRNDTVSKDYPAGVPFRNLASTEGAVVTLYAQWERVDFDIAFDVDSEPGDEDYPGIEKPDETINADNGPTVIEDPKRPGYVFQGWVIPDADGEHAIDQDLVYQDETDGKWYVDASKLPDYAGDDGRVELTARWTSVISVDVPSAATFYYDLVTDQSSEAHEAALSGTTSFSSRSQVDLRVCGLESVKAAGADALFSSGADSALLSVYPAKDGSAATVEDAQGPAGEKPSTAVDFALDDVVLEAAFSKAGPDAFSIPAGDDLTLSYRLNLGDGASLDYDKVLSMAEGDEASLASISYCFAADADVCCFWTIDDSGKTLSMFDIKADAEAIAAGDAATTAKYTAWMNADHRFYVKWYDQGVYELEGGLSENKCSIYEVRIIGINHDDKSDGSGKAGITFQFVECLNDIRPFGDADTRSWGQSTLRAALNDDTGAIWEQAPTLFRSNIETVSKHSYDAGSRGVTQDRLFLISLSELITAGTVWMDGSDASPNGWGELAKMRDVSPQYIFWKNRGISGMSAIAANQLLAKHAGSEICAWLTRSVSVGGKGSDSFLYLATVNTNLIPHGSGPATESRGVSPAFCF